MHEEKYAEAIAKIIENYPQYKNVKFDICDGEIGYTYANVRVNINELQQFINEFLGQKVYLLKYSDYVSVYARSEEEAKEFGSRIKPNKRIDNILLTDSKTI